MLADPRSWAGHGVALQRVDCGPIDFRVSLTSSMTVRNLCGYDDPRSRRPATPRRRTGAAGEPGRVRTSRAGCAARPAYVGDLAAYRIYMINHEDGHALGHQHAHQCLPGGLAPVMMQQTFGLRSAATGKICQANPWPYPPAPRARPAPSSRTPPPTTSTASATDRPTDRAPRPAASVTTEAAGRCSAASTAACSVPRCRR